MRPCEKCLNKLFKKNVHHTFVVFLYRGTYIIASFALKIKFAVTNYPSLKETCTDETFFNCGLFATDEEKILRFAIHTISQEKKCVFLYSLKNVLSYC